MLSVNPKLAIIVPYRDREEHLSRFVQHMEKFLEDKKIDFKIFVVEQGNDKPFNRGWLLNVGYKISKEQGYHYFCFHDIDMLPEDNSCDYSWIERPTHLATKLSKFNYRLVYPEYIGGVLLINKEHFELTNGFSNEYWGWGFEDDDFMYRCKEASLPLNSLIDSDKETKSKIVSCLELSGKDYVEIPMSKSLKNVFQDSFTIEAWVRASDDIDLNYNKDYDEFHVVTRPGYHTGLAYTSGLQYKGSIWDDENRQQMVVSDRKNDDWSHVVLTVDNLIQRLRMYVDGVETNYSPSDFVGRLRSNPPTTPLYIGCANPHTVKEDKGFFKGQISQVSIWNKSLNPKEVIHIFNNGLPCNVTKQTNYSGWKMGDPDYQSYDNVVGYWNFENVVGYKVLDNSGNDNHGIKKGGVIHDVELSVGSNTQVPYRRDGKYTCLEHEENGWDNTKFKHKETRQNQLRFINKVRKGLVDYKNDGLNSLTYQITNREEFLNKHEFISIQ